MKSGESRPHDPGAKPDEIAPKGSFWRRVRVARTTLLITALVVLCVAWLSGALDKRMDEWVDSNRTYLPQELPDDGRPAFVTTVRSGVTGLQPPPGSPLLLRLRLKLAVAYANLMNRLGKNNGAAYRFPPTPRDERFVYQDLNQCANMIGKRYLIAREAWGMKISFGTTSAMNGTQWVSAFEKALREDGWLFVSSHGKVVKIIPKDRLEDYRKAGLVGATEVAP